MTKYPNNVRKSFYHLKNNIFNDETQGENRPNMNPDDLGIIAISNILNQLYKKYKPQFGDQLKRKPFDKQCSKIEIYLTQEIVFYCY